MIYIFIILDCFVIELLHILLCYISLFIYFIAYKKHVPIPIALMMPVARCTCCLQQPLGLRGAGEDWQRNGHQPHQGAGESGI